MDDSRCMCGDSECPSCGVAQGTYQGDKEEQAKRIILGILIDQFSMTQEEDFLCETSINHSRVDFLIVDEAIGIRVSEVQPTNEIKTLHIHNAMVVIFPCGDPEEITEIVVNELKRIQVRKRSGNQAESDSDEW